jgi:hypothetical protein
MIPGLMSALSESVVASTTTIAVNSDIVYLTGTTTIATITAPLRGGWSSMIFAIPTTGTITTVTTGNIALALTMALNQVTVLVWSFKNSKWYMGAIS